MATLTTQVISLGGLAPTYGAAAASTKIQCDERTFLHVKNAAGSSMTVTLSSTAKVRSQAAADVVITVPATTGDMMIGPITKDLFAGLSDGLAAVAYSSTTSVTVAAVRI
jgi:predicted NAD/FAD-dependent oxidoreductase